MMIQLLMISKRQNKLNFPTKQPLNIKLDLCPDKMTIDEAKNAFCDKLKSDYMIMYMRMLTTCYIKTNPFMFEAYIEGDSIDKFC